jgi:hypothetical protein
MPITVKNPKQLSSGFLYFALDKWNELILDISF